MLEGIIVEHIALLTHSDLKLRQLFFSLLIINAPLL